MSARPPATKILGTPMLHGYLHEVRFVCETQKQKRRQGLCIFTVYRMYTLDFLFFLLSVASLRLMSPGAVTDGDTFFTSKSDDFFSHRHQKY